MRLALMTSSYDVCTSRVSTSHLPFSDGDGSFKGRTPLQLPAVQCHSSDWRKGEAFHFLTTIRQIALSKSLCRAATSPVGIQEEEEE
jgi:hypothetical protein